MAPPDKEPAAADPLIALTEALKEFRHSHTPTDSLKLPTFDWSSPDQYEELRLFLKSMESWYKLQGMTKKPGDYGT